MKIGVAQTKPIKGNVSANIEAHKRIIELAMSAKAEAIFFSELSLTGYEPELAKELATNQDDYRLDVFQQLSDYGGIIIGLGLPIRNAALVHIGMVVFETKKPRVTYAKQLLHEDEFPYFEKGESQIIITRGDIHIAPAICYESLHLAHAENAYNIGANIYLASVAKSGQGVNKALDHFPNVARQFGMPVLMANCVGACDNFMSVGRSSIWSKQGNLLGQLDDQSEGFLIFDTENEAIITRYLNGD